MAEESRLLKAVEGLDPLRQGAGSDHEVDSETFLGDIRARIADESTDVDRLDVVPRKIPRQTQRILMRVAAAVIIAFGLVTLTTLHHPDEALADWTAVPTRLEPASVTEMSQMCSLPVPTADGEIGPLHDVVSERRGENKAMLSVVEDENAEEPAYALCFEFAGGDTVRETSALPPGTFYTRPAAGKAKLVSVATWQPLPDHQEITVAIGRVGPGVKKVTLATSNGSFAQASQSKGWWMVWFPTKVPFDGEISVTTTQGAVHEFHFDAKQQ